MSSKYLFGSDRTGSEILLTSLQHNSVNQSVTSTWQDHLCTPGGTAD